MKPRTKLQYQVIDLSRHLSNLDNKMLLWAKVECLDHKGFATKKRVVCMDCGESFSPDLVNRKRATCPHCDSRLKIEQTRKTTDKQHIYISYADIIGEFQVIRNWEILSYHKAGKKAWYYISEVLQHWVLPNGKYETVARNHTVNWYCDSWNGLMEIRKEYRRYYYSSGVKYDIYPCAYHPQSQFKSEYTFYGINSHLEGLTFLQAIKSIPHNPKAETLLKSGQYSLLSFQADNGGKIYNLWPSIKICMRNKYIVKDSQMWIDYIELLQYFNKDLRNAYYVCPKDLKKEHDKLVSKKRLIQEKQKAERKRLKAIEDEKRFKKLKSCFFGIAFGDNKIQIRVLESVEEHLKEGDIMHHCVFTNEYYLKADSLILSATVADVPTETVEVSLKNMKVVQSRGKWNQNTEYHDRIISLVNKNIDLIRQRVKIKRNKRHEASALYVAV